MNIAWENGCLVPKGVLQNGHARAVGNTTSAGLKHRKGKDQWERTRIYRETRFPARRRKTTLEGLLLINICWSMPLDSGPLNTSFLPWHRRQKLAKSDRRSTSHEQQPLHADSFVYGVDQLTIPEWVNIAASRKESNRFAGDVDLPV